MTDPIVFRVEGLLLEDALLVQCGADDAEEAVRLASRRGSGVVLSGKRALDTARRVRNSEGPVRLLVDRRRYAGARRVPGTERFTAGWLDAQRRLGCPVVLSDSGYVGEGDRPSLVGILEQAAAAGGDVTAVLPLHRAWLSRDLDLLRDEVAAHGVPVALVLEHRGDPMSVEGTVNGFVTLLRDPTPVALLSTDVSALGALAYGATWTAVGVRTSLRHLYPAEAGGFGRVDSTPSALVDPALALLKVGKIAAAWAATSDDASWVCTCLTCGGRTLEWLLVASEHECNAHTFELLLDRRDRLVSAPLGAQREASWQAQCASAAFQYEALALAGVAWEVPRFLKHWRNVR